jgi:hypothetical protein
LPRSDPDPPRREDEPSVRRWPRAVRLAFLILAAVGCWAIVALLAWLFWRRLTH